MHTEHKQPHAYPRRILLVVIGMTPQIVTETLYKLAVQGRPAFVPTEIHLITTSEGAESAKLALLGLGTEPGWFQRLQEDYSLPPIHFGEDTVHVIADTEGNFIDDDQSTAHNRIASDFITHTVHAMTEDPDSALHVSLAGGRKTMSFYAGYALSLYGRLQDRLSHVLVSEPFQNREFFYPPPEPVRLKLGGKYYSIYGCAAGFWPARGHWTSTPTTLCRIIYGSILTSSDPKASKSSGPGTSLGSARWRSKNRPFSCPRNHD